MPQLGSGKSNLKKTSFSYHTLLAYSFHGSYHMHFDLRSLCAISLRSLPALDTWTRTESRQGLTTLPRVIQPQSIILWSSQKKKNSLTPVVVILSFDHEIPVASHVGYIRPKLQPGFHLNLQKQGKGLLASPSSMRPH
jgi:hypothetical protein